MAFGCGVFAFQFQWQVQRLFLALSKEAAQSDWKEQMINGTVLERLRLVAMNANHYVANYRVDR